MHKILVVGDLIKDQYSFCKAVKISPEAPALVLHVTEERNCEGGAGLVAANLRSLLGDQRCVTFLPGSISHKHRIFAERTLLCRIDKDTHSVIPGEQYWDVIFAALSSAQAVVVSDYGKGALSYNLSHNLSTYCTDNKIPLFVDAKSDPVPYKGCFAIFPNEHEHNGLNKLDYQHVIRKLGPRGCSVDGIIVETEEQHVYDVTGAGDVFIAAFVSSFLRVKDLHIAAEYANRAAGISVRHLGTYIVRPEELL